MGTWWEALVVKENSRGRNIGTLLVAAGADIEGRQGGGGGTEQRNHWEDWLVTRLRWESELSQINPSVREVCVGAASLLRSNLSRAHDVRNGKKLLQELQTLDSTTTRRALVRFKRAWEKGDRTFVKCLGSSKKTRCRAPGEGRP